MHEHNICKHEGSLRHCPICDVVYCVDCKKEWKNNIYTWYQPYWGTGSITYCGSTITCNHG